MLKRIAAIILSTIILCSTGLIVNAEGVAHPTTIANNISGIQPYYEYANIVTATLSKSNGKAVCNANVIGYNGTTTKIKITMTLQKKTLLWWSTVDEWTTTVNSYQAVFSKTRAVNSGKHRVKVCAIVYSGSNSETININSATVEF